MTRILIFLTILSATFEARAYRLYRTDEGEMVRWNKQEVTVYLDQSLAKLGPLDAVAEVIEQTFMLWTDRAGLPVDFVFSRRACRHEDNPRENCIMACGDEDDCYLGGASEAKAETGATTFLRVHPSTGEIKGADIVFNARDWRWDVGSSEKGALNLARVAAHEIGHFVGIDHSEEMDAIMYFALSQYDTADPTLHEDDVLAVQNLYEGLADEDGYIEGDVTPADCSVSNVASGGSDTATLGFLLFALLFFWRRARA